MDGQNMTPEISGFVKNRHIAIPSNGPLKPKVSF